MPQEKKKLLVCCAHWGKGMCWLAKHASFYMMLETKWKIYDKAKVTRKDAVFVFLIPFFTFPSFRSWGQRGLRDLLRGIIVAALQC